MAFMFMYIRMVGRMREERNCCLIKCGSGVPGGLLKKLIMIWDQFRNHRTEVVKRKLGEQKTQLVVILGGPIRQIQHVDVSINKPLKRFIGEKWIKWEQFSDFEVTAS